MIDPALDLALREKLSKGGWTPDLLDKAVREACLVEARSERFPTATAVVEVLMGTNRTLHFHFEGTRILGATNAP